MTPYYETFFARDSEAFEHGFKAYLRRYDILEFPRFGQQRQADLWVHGYLMALFYGARQ